ncbi:erythrocyte membrane protein 1 [Plasmodium falciparum IGH-CR14]|uniref:Erythrocyte membrane protein 1 n=1 Tax=Plasmodium falciparum IGH-CR14 TaxID=580059 RepID=A0A0L1I307_PLAFA|nr:erythrocyte membrane protein 1 [Plasmodium falciparum IGH-CR14]
MAPQGGRPGGAGGSSGEEDAKNMFDRIGQQVHEKVKSEAENYIGELKGFLTSTTILGELVSSPNPCTLVEEYYKHPNGGGARGKRYPCANRSPVRFSDEYGGQCTFNRIKDSQEGDNDVGACAPYRRLHLCDYNLEKMGRTSTAKHDLLAEVCMAAKYEGNSINSHYPKYEIQYPSSGSGFTLCTMLARSFADIGDIVRGKDLYRGDKKKDQQEKVRLEENLKKIFKQIYEELIKKNTKNGKAKDRYQDEIGGNFFKLREDWWTANRHTVWEAITCDVKSGSQYFRQTCGGSESPSMARDKCRCDGDQVPTYFDYVPQYLRWFEEWAEDFCTKRKHKLQNAIKICRNDEEQRYCSGNGYNCKDTIRAENKLVEGDECHKCSVSCKPFVKWIDNQKLEFDKQKKKYANEINGSNENTEKETKHGPINNLYVKDFYDILKEQYRTVENFLQLLSNEKICKDPPKVGDKKARSVDFTKDEANETFCRTEYCKPCPLCGLGKQAPPWNPKEDTDCVHRGIKTFDDRNSNPINLLVKDVTGTSIVEKLGGLCNTPSKPTIQTWKCRFESSQNYYCVLQNDKKNTPQQEIESFNSLFWHWITEMFEDSIKWRKEHGNCINNNNTCKKGCKKPCDCFKNWVDQKKKEWQQVLEVYDKQPDFNEAHPYVTFEYLLKDEYFPKIKAPYKEVKSVQEMQRINNENLKDILKCTKENNSINTFLGQEEKEAKNCVTNNPHEKCKEQKKPQPGGAARAETGPSPDTPLAGDTVHEVAEVQEEEEDEDNHSDSDEDGGEVEVQEAAKEDRKGEVKETAEHTTEDTEGDETEVVEETVAEATETTQENVCATVDNILTKDNNALKDACDLKYNKGKNYGWKCVPTTSGGGKSGEAKSRERREAPGAVTATGSSGNDGATGGLCIPPRRRRLYVTPLTRLAGGDGTTQSSQPQTGGKAQTQDDTTSQSEKLRDAFIESAAVETFFLWDRYKKIKDKERQEKQKRDQEANGLGLGYGGGGELGGPQLPGTDNDNPQTLLQKGHIPPEFLRQMFYTLGDYRDICIGKTPNGIDTVSASDKDTMEKIKTAIESVLKPSGSSSPPSEKNSGQTTKPEDWWERNAKDIWKGMICALTYKDNTDSGPKSAEGTNKIEKDNEVYKKFFGNTPDKPANPGTYESKYEYSKVELKEEDSGTEGPKLQTESSSSGEKTRLSEFVLRPPYFRYLEEWGETFCRQRTYKLEKIENECRGDGKKKCSGYGEDCKTIFSKKYDTITSLECPDCGRECRKYKQWIERKKIEFTQQSNAFTKQKTDAQKNNGDNGFCATLNTYSKAGDFLQTLKNGPCKNNSEEGNGKVNNIFEDIGETFKDAENCKPCSQFNVNCKVTGNCDNNKGENCNGTTTITASDIKNGGDSTEINMLVSDNNPNGFHDLNECKDAHIFKGIRKHEWKCRNECGYVLCKPEKGNEKNDGTYIIQIRALFKRWVEYFFEDYNKINAKLSHCINNGESECINGCQKKCKCVEKWMSTKKQEWQQIKNRLLDQYKYEDQPDYPVTSFLQELIPQIDVTIDKKNYTSLEKLVKKFKCKCADSSKSDKEGNKKDIVECLLEYLDKKATSCPGKPSGDQTNCVQSSPLPDEEYENEEENDKKVEPPTFCEIKDTPEQEEEGGCDAPEEKTKENDQAGAEELKPPADSPPAGPSPGDDQTDRSKDTVEKVDKVDAPIKPPPRPTPPPNLFDHPLLKPALMSSTIMWSIGIGFAAFTYFVLKKKTKSTIDLLRVINIPKGDYGIPTLKSTNRYIPYGTDRYKGKTYIYMEGDTDEDKYTFMSDTTDITSSSESEYEEIDINDIYVPGSPKYKTLIEVVLEPSKRDTSNKSSGTKDTQNITTSDTPRNKPINDVEWNSLKNDFISNILQNSQMDLPQNNISRDTSINIHPAVSILQDSMQEKPFITSIQDRDLHNGEEVTYNINLDDHKNMNFSTNHDNITPKNNQNDLYTGIDLINDSISGNHNVDIYDELLKRKENELFGTNHTKHTTTNSVAKQTLNDPILNQINLFHKWLDRHKNMCEQWDKNKKEELLDKLKKEWEQDYKNNSDDIHNRYENVLNTDVSIQINMNDPKPINEFTNMDTNPNNFVKDTILDDLDKHPETYFYDIYDDDITYFDIDDEKTPMGDIHIKEQTEMNALHNNKMNELLEKEYPISDIWNI